LAFSATLTATPSQAETLEAVAKVWIGANQEAEDLEIIGKSESKRLAYAECVAFLKRQPQFKDTPLSDKDFELLVSMLSSEVMVFKPFPISEGGRQGLQIKTKIRINEYKIPDKPEEYLADKASGLVFYKMFETQQQKLESDYRTYLGRLSQATDPAYVQMLKQQEGNLLRKRAQAASLIDEADRFNNNGEQERAIKLLDQVVQQDPNNPMAYMSRAAVLGEQKKYNEAIRELSRAIELAPKESVFYYLRGNYHFMDSSMSSNSNALALRDANKAIQLNPEFADAYNMRGFIHKYYTKDCFKALEDFARACELGAKYSCKQRSC
jgi:tetratricopeptide (TPR) repeat protein